MIGSLGSGKISEKNQESRKNSGNSGNSSENQVVMSFFNNDKFQATSGVFLLLSLLSILGSGEGGLFATCAQGLLEGKSL